MPSEPEDNLEGLFAQEEAAIRDDGFSARVMEQAKPASAWRKPVIYGAGLLGAGFAAGGMSEIAPHFRMGEWFEGVFASVKSAASTASVDLTQAQQSVPDTLQFAIVALVVGVSLVLAAMASQAR